MGTIRFRPEDFSSLGMLEYETPYTNIGLTSLSENEQAIMIVFLGLLGDPLGDAPIDNQDLLTVRAKDDLLDALYGPCVFKDDEGGMFLKVGSNRFPITQDGNTFKCGALDGELEFQESKTITVKDADGEDVQVDFQRCTMALLPIEASIEYDYVVDVRLDPLQEVTKAQAKRAFKAGQSLSEFLLPPFSGGDGTLKMRDMKVGEYKVESIDEGGLDRFGKIPFTINTVSGLKIKAQGNSYTTLEQGYKMTSKTPLTLVIKSIEKGNDGKFYVKNALVIREPKSAEPVLETKN